MTNRVREIRTPGSVGALGGNPQSDPARISFSHSLPGRSASGRQGGFVCSSAILRKRRNVICGGSTE